MGEHINLVRTQRTPSGAKARGFIDFSGTTRVVPFQTEFCIISNFELRT